MSPVRTFTFTSSRLSSSLRLFRTPLTKPEPAACLPAIAATSVSFLILTFQSSFVDELAAAHARLEAASAKYKAYGCNSCLFLSF